MAYGCLLACYMLRYAMLGATMYLVAGEPLDFADLVREHRAAGRPERELHAAITARAHSVIAQHRRAYHAC